MASVPHVFGNGRFLFVDGLESDWQSVNEWIDRLSSDCPAVNREECDPFSYFASNEPYDADHTLSHLDKHIQRFVDYLTEATQSVTPVGFSLGAVVSLIGAARAIDAGRPIERLVIVAPATSPSDLLYRAYRIARHGDVPDVIEELCVADSPRRIELKRAFAHLLNVGVVVQVIFAPEDDYCPFVWPCITVADDMERLVEHFVDVLRGRAKRVDFHVGLRTHSHILKALCEALG